MINNDHTSTLARRESAGASQNLDFPPDPQCIHCMTVQRENGEIREIFKIFNFLAFNPMTSGGARAF